MMEIRSYRDLRVWQRATDLCVGVYELTGEFPNDERFGLVSQIRRAAVSVPSNIAEGFGRGGLAEYIRFLRIAKGSLNESDTQLFLSSRLGFLKQVELGKIVSDVSEVARLLGALIKSLESRN